MPIKLYYSDLSAPARSIRILIKLLNLDIEQIEINLEAGEHLTQRFTRLNPFQTVPTLVDGDFVLWECRAILTYLVDTYASGNPLYPSDLQERATVNRWLFWDASTLTPFLTEFYRPFAKSARKPSASQFERFDNKISDLNKVLLNNRYITGKTMTLADISIALNIKLVNVFEIDIPSKYFHIDTWLQRLERDLGPAIWKEFVEIPTQALKAYVKTPSIV